MKPPQLKTIRQFYGLRFFGYGDAYEVGLRTDRETVLKHLGTAFQVETIGRAYDGSYILQPSLRTEIAVFVRPDSLEFFVRSRATVCIRLWPSRFRRQIQRFIELVWAEQNPPIS